MTTATVSPAVSCVWEASATLGEGPCWAAGEQAIYWVDIIEQRLFRYDTLSSQRQMWKLDQQLTALAPRAQGGYVGTLRHGFALLELPALEITPLDNPPEAHLPGNRFNDGKVDSFGNFWAGTMDDGESAESGVLYRLNPDLSWDRCDDGYCITNGPAFSLNGDRLYHTDTLARKIYVFDVDAQGYIGNKRLFIELPEESGFPDGMTVDAEGCLWVCHFAGWGITRFSPEGEKIGRIDLPVANVTSCTFAGENLDTLYITTARKGLSEQELEEQPLAGGLFRCKPGIQGVAPNVFAG